MQKKKEEELKEKLQSGGAREAVSKIGSKSVDDRSSLISTEDNAYGKWVNDKLTRGGHSPIRIDKMLKEFYEDTSEAMTLVQQGPLAAVDSPCKSTQSENGSLIGFSEVIEPDSVRLQSEIETVDSISIVLY